MEDENFGVSHAEDVIYLFPMLKFLAPHRVMSARDLAFGKEFVQLFTDFASFGYDLYFWFDTLKYNYCPFQ